MRITVEGLPGLADPADLRAAFAAFGTVTTVMIRQEAGGETSATVDMPDPEEARAAFTGVQGRLQDRYGPSLSYSLGGEDDNPDDRSRPRGR